MRTKQNQGFALILAVVCFVLVGAAMVILNRLSVNLQFDTTRYELQARQRDMSASARAWAQTHRSQLNKADFQGVELPTDSLCVPDGKLGILPTEDRKHVDISAECKRGEILVRKTTPFAFK